ncbi:hypothetical protein [Absidia glauca]|jgi:hypothetical protein|uniref:Uncharacterized protein n=1 Tax=Absidia glauca TaxID=4829 RepID=A0A163KJB4_ABSGL|nr:hypothetical protein [Absidia glauca]
MDIGNLDSVFKSKTNDKSSSPAAMKEATGDYDDPQVGQDNEDKPSVTSVASAAVAYAAAAITPTTPVTTPPK